MKKLIAIFLLAFACLQAQQTPVLFDAQTNVLKRPTAQQLADANPELAGGGGTPGGSDTHVQFNDAGSFGGDAGMVFNKTTNALTISGVFSASNVSGSNTGDQTTVTGNAGSATVLATPRAIYGNNFDGSAALTQIIAAAFGGTGNGFTAFTGPTTSTKTFTLPNASSTVLTDNAAVTVAQGGTGRQTGTTAYSLIATGTTATGAQQTLANGATTEVLVGGGASALPVWTTATGSGAPVRATSPTLVTPALGTPSSGTVTNLTGTASININGTVGATTPNTGSFTTLTTSGVNTLPGSFIRTPATITITEASPDTGPITITNGYSQATIDEATTLTPSAAGTNGQFLTLDVINSGGSVYVVTVDTASDFTFNAAASATTTVIMRSNGSGWALVGGDPSVIGLSADTTPASTLLVSLTDPATGTNYKATVDQLANADSTLASSASTNIFTNKTLDASATGNVVKLWGYLVLTHPHVFGGGVTQQTTVTNNQYGQALFANATDKATNYVEYYLVIPPDIDTAVDLTATFKIQLAAGDTGDHEYEISFDSVANSAAYSGTLGDAISLAYTADASGAANDVETAGETTLTGWRSAMTAGQLMVIRLARDGDHANDTSTQNSYSGPLVIKYGITQ